MAQDGPAAHHHAGDGAPCQRGDVPPRKTPRICRPRAPESGRPVREARHATGGNLFQAGGVRRRPRRGGTLRRGGLPFRPGRAQDAVREDPKDPLARTRLPTPVGRRVQPVARAGTDANGFASIARGRERTVQPVLHAPDGDGPTGGARSGTGVEPDSSRPHARHRFARRARRAGREADGRDSARRGGAGGEGYAGFAALAPEDQHRTRAPSAAATGRRDRRLGGRSHSYRSHHCAGRQHVVPGHDRYRGIRIPSAGRNRHRIISSRTLPRPRRTAGARVRASQRREQENKGCRRPGGCSEAIGK